MPSRDLKDQMQSPVDGMNGNTLTEQPIPQTFEPTKSIQLTSDEELQKTLVEVVMDDLTRAESDRNEKNYGITSKGEKLNFDDWYKRIKDLYSGDRIPKTIPWRFCSNRSLRIGASILDLLHARLFPAVWNEDLTRWRSMKAVDTPKVDRISKMMDWWIRVHAPLHTFYDNWVKVTTGFGDSLAESSWDIEDFIMSEQEDIPITDEMGQPLTNPDGTPAKQSQPKINRVEKSVSRLIPKDSVYFLKGARDVQRDPVIIKETVLFKELEDLAREGAVINIDKLKEHIVVPVVSGSLSDQDKERIKNVKIRNMPVDIVREYLRYDVDGVGVNESVRCTIAPAYRLYLGGVRMRDVTKSGRRPLKFTKYDSYLDRPEELEGEGVLTKVRELADEIDAIFNQMTDAHTLAVLRPFFYDPSGDIDAPALNLGPNKGIPVTNPNQNVYFPQIEIPTERLVNAIRLVMEFIERLTAASSYVMGKESDRASGSGTATKTTAILHSAEIRFTLPSERLRRAAAEILNQHLDLIQLNIPKGLEQRVLGEKGEAVFRQGELSEEGISGEFDAFLLPDPSMGSKQTERDLAGVIYSMLLQNVIVGTDPKKIYFVTSQWLKANGKEEEFIQQALGPAPSQDDIDNPEDENTLMIQGDFARVVPQITENHLYHIQKHMDLMKSPTLLEMAKVAPELTKQIMDYNQLHIQQHIQMMTQMQALMQKSTGGDSGGISGQNKGAVGQGADGTPALDARNNSMENVQGAAGKALDTQRKGKVGGPTGFSNG